MARRQSTLKRKRLTAGDFPQPKSVELEQRIARLEGTHRELAATGEELKREFIALRAELDHLTARLTRFG